uniref:MFS domain-containing protein n=1 Tax=Parastrongyloides trichosuri TaxID=131310 RepID=A0A0N4ZA10_PARTI
MELLDDTILKLSKKSMSGMRLQTIIICAIFSIVQFFELNLIWYKVYHVINCSTSISILQLDARHFSLHSNLQYSEYPNHISCHSTINPYLHLITYFLGNVISLTLAFLKSLNYSPKKCFTIACLFSLIFIELLSLISLYWISLLLKFMLGFTNGFLTQYGILIIIDWSHPKYVAFRGNCIIGSKIISLIFLAIIMKIGISIKVTYFGMALVFVFLILLELIFVKESRSYLRKTKNFDLLLHYLRSLARQVDYHGEAITEKNLANLNNHLSASQELVNDVEDKTSMCITNYGDNIEEGEDNQKMIVEKICYKKYFWITITL